MGYILKWTEHQHQCQLVLIRSILWIKPHTSSFCGAFWSKLMELFDLYYLPCGTSKTLLIQLWLLSYNLLTCVSILGKIDSDRLIRLSILCYIMYWRSGCTLSNLGTFITHWNKFWKSTHLYAGDGGVLVRFNHSVVCFHVHQPEQQVLPPSSLQNL